MRVATGPAMIANDRNHTPEDSNFSEIKTRYAAGYAIDSELVAQEILRKLRLVKWARRALVSEPGRTPAPSARGR